MLSGVPRHPLTSPTLSTVGSSVFSNLAHRMANYRGEIYPLHVGDTWLEPAEGCRMEDLHSAVHAGLHRYAPPRGMLPLLEAVAARVAQRTGVATTPDEVLISAGATGGLCAAMGALLDPGDEVLILAPYWPLIPGVVRCARGTPVVVPFIGNVDSAEGAVETVKRHVSPRTAALYMSTPNNPTGAVLPRAWIEALVSWAAVEGLWVVSDEVYEDYVYRGEHVYCRQLAPERTISAHSFSKAFGMAGNRCGWIVGPAALMRDMCKVSTHAFYSTPTASQVAGCRALDGRGDAWIERARTSYRQVGEAAAARLGLPPPEGSTFLFWDVAAHLDERGLAGLLERCADRGLILAPGPSFGPYPTHVRLCFTSSPPDVVARGVELLAEMLNLPPRA